MSTVEPRKYKTEWSEHDDNCSKSCTRAGVAVLLVSAFAISMLPLLSKIESLNAILDYVSKRIKLKEELTLLQSDPVWSRLKASDPSAETWGLDKLLTYAEPKPTVPGEPVSQEPPLSDILAHAHKLLGGGISSRQIVPIHIMAKTLEELSDNDLRNRARKHSYRYDTSIARWAFLLDRLDIIMPDSFSFALSEKENLRAKRVSRLTLPQVEKLVNFNLPEISEHERLLRKASITLPSIGVPLDPTPATLFVEVALLLLISYFWIWYREARVSPNFPVSGTLFGALARSTLSRLMFSLLIALPPIGAALVAVRTVWLTYWNVFFAILVTIVAFLIRRQGKL